jgi:hypothetical protein
MGFLLVHVPDSFDCPTCLRPGRIERERSRRTGDADLYSEVRVEFDYDLEQRIYLQDARIEDERLLARHGVYTLRSPLIRTRAQALRVGRAVLQKLNRSLDGRVPPRGPTRRELIAQGWPVLA